MNRTTILRGAAWIVAWDETHQRHAYLRDTDVVFTGNTIVHVGPGYDEPVDVEVDARAHSAQLVAILFQLASI